MIAIFYAIEAEIRESLEDFEIIKEIRLSEWGKGKYEGVVREITYRGRKIILAQTGWRETPGAGNLQAKEVAEFVLESFPIRTVIVAATGGGLKEYLKTGDYVICNPICFEDRSPLFPDDQLCAIAAETLRQQKARLYFGMSLTCPSFAWRLEDKIEIAQEHPEVMIIEMENYFIASAAAKKEIPFLAVRIVSDEFKEYEGKEVVGHEIKKAGNILYGQFLQPFLQRF